MQSSNNKVILGLGAAVALLAGVAIAVVLSGKGDGPTEAPAASQGGLQVSVNETPAPASEKQLRCFVDGQPAGILTLDECARRNGVAAQALDVGLDETGALAAAPTASLAPPPALPKPATDPAATPPVTPVTPTATPTPAATAGPQSACLRFTGGEWREVSGATSLNACVQSLFAGRCVRPGEADYGRFGDSTLRLVPGRVEQSADNRKFRTLVEQRRGCDIPPIR
jgi:hypothetical protein